MDSAPLLRSIWYHLRQLRYHYLQREIAERLGVSLRTVAYWQKEERRPGLRHQRLMREWCEEEGLAEPLRPR